MSAANCPYCGTPEAPNASTCVGCGAPLDITRRPTASGWLQLPAARDMARIQCGRSSVQIEGTIVPVADFTLADQDGLYFAHHELLWKHPEVTIKQLGIKGAWKRMLAGLPIRMLTATGPGRIALSRDAAGEVLAIPIAHGDAVDVREHVFMVATSSVTYDYFLSGVWFVTRSGDERETHYPLGMLMDRFSAPTGPGLLLIHAHGDAFVRVLGPGQSILLKPAALLYKDTSVEMNLHIERARNQGGFWGALSNPRSVWVRLTGPGRVAMQSAYGHFHDPASSIYDTPSNATEQQW